MPDTEESFLSKSWDTIKKIAKRAKNGITHPLTSRFETENFSQAFSSARKQEKKNFYLGKERKCLYNRL